MFASLKRAPQKSGAQLQSNLTINEDTEKRAVRAGVGRFA